MKQFLFSILTACSLGLHAQQQGAMPVIIRDSNFVFDKHYYELENRWVVSPKNNSFRGMKTLYTLGFIIFDAEKGYSIFYDGKFDVDANGHAVRDTTSMTKSPKKSLYPAGWPFRFQLLPIAKLMAAIPDNMLNDLGLKKVPDWLKDYRRKNPDTIKSLEKKIQFGRLYHIYAKEVNEHIGDNAVVQGMIYGGRAIVDQDRPWTKIVFLYMGGGNYPNQKLTIIIKDAGERAQDWLTALKVSPQPQEKTGLEVPLYSVKGKIFLYDKKPAIEISKTELGMVSWVDRSPTAAEIKKFE
ncbi:hypothetical protein [Mucilaginibacter sp. UR6-11]|uniref:hypothetical protein n=1 Tax=Mucilaginibacter sp. UR6-11 TaxID=1435644 RepID=UPI001E5F594A|nr:hypothetical protein [Mucilaginibacter sp. UR6-11]MCC8424704.1 hypothetical protein [Mucilaginibacter sp. UR6-11]